LRRLQLLGLFQELRPYWLGHQDFTTTLMTSMVHDLRTTLPVPSPPPPPATADAAAAAAALGAAYQPFLLLLPVVCSVVASCAPSISQGWAVVPDLLAALREAATRTPAFPHALRPGCALLVQKQQQQLQEQQQQQGEKQQAQQLQVQPEGGAAAMPTEFLQPGPSVSCAEAACAGAGPVLLQQGLAVSGEEEGPVQHPVLHAICTAVQRLVLSLRDAMQGRRKTMRVGGRREWALCTSVRGWLCLNPMDQPLP